MDKVDELLGFDEESVDPPPNKKKKANTDQEENEAMKMIEEIKNLESNKDVGELRARRELKALLKKNKHLDIDKLMESHHFVNSLSREEISELLENVKLEVGMISPTQNAKNILSIVGGLMKLISGVDLGEKLTNDLDLITALEHYLPDPLDMMSIPLQFASRIGYHILNHSIEP